MRINFISYAKLSTTADDSRIKRCRNEDKTKVRWFCKEKYAKWKFLALSKASFQSCKVKATGTKRICELEGVPGIMVPPHLGCWCTLGASASVSDGGRSSKNAWARTFSDS